MYDTDKNEWVEVSAIIEIVNGATTSFFFDKMDFLENF